MSRLSLLVLFALCALLFAPASAMDLCWQVHTTNRPATHLVIVMRLEDAHDQLHWLNATLAANATAMAASASASASTQHKLQQDALALVVVSHTHGVYTSHLSYSLDALWDWWHNFTRRDLLSQPAPAFNHTFDVSDGVQTASLLLLRARRNLLVKNITMVRQFITVLSDNWPITLERKRSTQEVVQEWQRRTALEDSPPPIDPDNLWMDTDLAYLANDQFERAQAMHVSEHRALVDLADRADIARGWGQRLSVVLRSAHKPTLGSTLWDTLQSSRAIVSRPLRLHLYRVPDLRAPRFLRAFLRMLCLPAVPSKR